MSNKTVLMTIAGVMLLLGVLLAVESLGTTYSCTTTGEGHTCPMPPMGA